jgi:DNA-binding response OmpR family regulator
MLLEDMLNELGHDMVASAANIEDAHNEATTRQIDLAILDVNLGRQSSYPLASVLSARGIPYILATGYGRRGLGQEWGQGVVLEKPFEVSALSAAIAESMAARPAP